MLPQRPGEACEDHDDFGRLAASSVEQLVERLFGAVLGMMDVHPVYVGERLGLYRALADSDVTTSAELAAATATDERYVREWLEQPPG